MFHEEEMMASQKNRIADKPARKETETDGDGVADRQNAHMLQTDRNYILTDMLIC